MTMSCWWTPVLMGCLTVPLAAGLPFAAAAHPDVDSEIQRIMEQVNAKNRAIGKGLRSVAAPDAAARKALVAEARALTRLGQEARTLTEPARERKKSQQDWTRTVEEFLSSSEELVTVLADPASSRSRTKQAYEKVQRTCLKCHSTFRDESD